MHKLKPDFLVCFSNCCSHRHDIHRDETESALVFAVNAQQNRVPYQCTMNGLLASIHKTINTNVTMATITGMAYPTEWRAQIFLDVPIVYLAQHDCQQIQVNTLTATGSQVQVNIRTI